VPFLKEFFGTFSAFFQWLDLLKSETLVFTTMRSTRKPEVPKVREVPENQKYQKIKSTRKPKALVQKSVGHV
jgi:hypothetical protein